MSIRTGSVGERDHRFQQGKRDRVHERSSASKDRGVPRVSQPCRWTLDLQNACNGTAGIADSGQSGSVTGPLRARDFPDPPIGTAGTAVAHISEGSKSSACIIAPFVFSSLCPLCLGGPPLVFL